MLMIVPLQDWTSIDETVRYPGDPQDERINIPANSPLLALENALHP